MYKTDTSGKEIEEYDATFCLTFKHQLCPKIQSLIICYVTITNMIDAAKYIYSQWIFLFFVRIKQWMKNNEWITQLYAERVTLEPTHTIPHINESIKEFDLMIWKCNFLLCHVFQIS